MRYCRVDNQGFCRSRVTLIISKSVFWHILTKKFLNVLKQIDHAALFLNYPWESWSIYRKLSLGRPKHLFSTFWIGIKCSDLRWPNYRYTLLRTGIFAQKFFVKLVSLYFKSAVNMISFRNSVTWIFYNFFITFNNQLRNILASDS